MDNYIKILEKQIFHPRILHSAKLSVNGDAKIKTFPDSQILKKCLMHQVHKAAKWMCATTMKQKTEKKIQDPEIKGANTGEHSQNDGKSSPGRDAV